MAPRRKLIVVSNRGPVTFGRDGGGERIARRGGGGLVTALRSLVSHHDVTWIASAMSDEDRRVAAEAGGAAVEERSRDGSRFRLRLVAHDETAYDWFYNVVANPMLWFLQHYLWELAYTPSIDIALQNAWHGGYARVNEGFAEAVIEELEAEPEAAVFFHDYHLYLAPRLVREEAPDALLAHFVHIPWPQTDYWHVLPDTIRRAIHEGLLANDVIGFHTHQWRLNFLRAASDLAGAETDFEEFSARDGGRRSLAVVHPISVDPGEFDDLASSPPVLEAERVLSERRPEKLILRVDRTDPSKNIVRGFRAFELYLEAHPEMHSRVSMLALLDPSRQDIPEYAEYLGAIQREARRVNDRFQREGWTPVELVVQDDFVGSVAAYKQFDALFVNAIFDGMNLVAKEAPLVNGRDGVLILSENAGAHAELGEWALTVNPFDVAGQAEAIHRALTLPAEERRERIEAIRDHVREHDVVAWIDAQLADLDRCAAGVG
ncbi:MAG TPA: trehalose-6-phosphate synthase [Gaiellaceae bacterium]|jgi:trehalose 6-phosphate synthase|nr:trehalose-6-phosphate synthase [Gaiellaceae bacterium]